MPLVTIASTIKDTLSKSGVYPDVLDPFEHKALIIAQYKDKQVASGNTLSPSETSELPNITLSFAHTEKDASYTLVLTDPDAPKRGDNKWSEYAHYIISNIRPNVESGESFRLDPAKGQTLLPYMGPAPPQGTGPHRYVYVLYKENGPVDGLPSEERANWGTNKPGSGVREWAPKNKLTPWSANFFLAENA